jgi:hypothetical protein
MAALRAGLSGSCGCGELMLVRGYPGEAGLEKEQRTSMRANALVNVKIKYRTDDNQMVSTVVSALDRAFDPGQGTFEEWRARDGAGPKIDSFELVDPFPRELSRQERLLFGKDVDSEASLFRDGGPRGGIPVNRQQDEGGGQGQGHERLQRQPGRTTSAAGRYDGDPRREMRENAPKMLWID